MLSRFKVLLLKYSVFLNVDEKLFKSVLNPVGPWVFSLGIFLGYFPWVFSVGIFRGYFPWVFSVGIFRGYFPWVFSVGIIRGYYPWVLSVGFPWVPTNRNAFLKNTHLYYPSKTDRHTNTYTHTNTHVQRGDCK